MSTTATSEQIETVVTEALVRLGTPAETITPDALFASLDIDSLDLAELAQIVEEEFDVELKGSDLKDIASIGDLIAAIGERAG